METIRLSPDRHHQAGRMIIIYRNALDVAAELGKGKTADVARQLLDVAATTSDAFTALTGYSIDHAVEFGMERKVKRAKGATR